MALKKLLTVQAIELLQRITGVITRDPTEFQKDTSVAVEMMRLSMGSGASELEKAILLLTFIYLRRLNDLTDPQHRRAVQSRRTYTAIKQPIMDIANSIVQLSITADDSKFITWAIMVLMATAKDIGLTDAKQDELLSSLTEHTSRLRSKDQLLAVLRQFFFHQYSIPDVDNLYDRMKELRSKSG